MQIIPLFAFSSNWRKSLIKPFLIMKLTGILIIICCLQASANGYGQKITLAVNNAQAKNVFRSIEKQSGFSFIYAKEQLVKMKSIDLAVVNTELKLVLDLLFANQSLTYTLSGNNIILKEKPLQLADDLLAAKLPLPFIVSGTIADEEGMPLENVSVVLKSTGKGVASDKEGKFSIPVLGESDVLVFSYVGYINEELKVGKAGTFSILLKRKDARVEEVIVVGYGTQKKRDVTGAVASLSKDRLQQLPNTNIAQALQGSVPGLQINTNGGGAEGNALAISRLVAWHAHQPRRLRPACARRW